MDLRFYVGLHQPSDAQHFKRCFISINRLKRRVSDFAVGNWIMDSGAFTELRKHGEFRMSVDEYAGHIERWKSCGQLEAAATQDYLCDPPILEQTGLSIRRHQELTVERYGRLQALTSVDVMPVLQGQKAADYVRHLEMYGSQLETGQLVGVGSIVRISRKPGLVARILTAIIKRRPDLRIHGFGLKYESLRSPIVRECLYSADSMAWSYHARYMGRNANDWREARRFVDEIENPDIQGNLFSDKEHW